MTTKQIHNQDGVTTSRQAGMSEITTSILHDVGNVLNSLNTSVDFIHEHLSTSKIDKLTKALIKIELTCINNDKSSRDKELKLLLSYINEVARHLNKEHALFQNELDSIRKNIDHIKSVIQTQQHHAKKSAATETTQINHLIDEALAFLRTSITTHKIIIETNYSNLPSCTIDKHMVLQILINLINNAIQALATQDNSNRKIIIQTQCLNTKKFKITVKDNGPGIEDYNLIKIFNHGFTTRKTGHGFGLHGCANAAKSLGGKLSAYSDGLSRGAVFTLELPFH